MKTSRTPWTVFAAWIGAGCCLVPSAAAQSIQSEGVVESDTLRHAYHEYEALDDREALNVVNDFLVNNPMHVQGSELRARCLLYLGRVEEAVKTLRRIPDLPPTSRLLLAELYGLQGNQVEAQRIVDQVLLEDSGRSDARVKRAKIMLKVGQFQQALSELEIVRRIDARNAETCLVAGMALEGMRKYAESAQQYQRLLVERSKFDEFDPHYELQAVEGVARVSSLAGEHSQSIHWYNQLIERFEDRGVTAPYHFRVAVAHSMLLDYEKAEEHLMRALELDGDNGDYRLAQAELYRETKQYEKSIEAFEWLAERMDNPGIPSVRLAELYLKQGDLNRASLHSSVAEGLLSDSPEVHEIAGRVKQRLGDLGEASQSFQRAVQLDPTNISMRHLGQLLSKSDNPAEKKEGKRWLKQYQDAAPYFPGIRQIRAELKASPRNPLLMTRLAILYNSISAYAHARQVIDDTVRRAPGDVTALTVAGCIAANQQQNDLAVQYFRSALQARDALPAEARTGDPVKLKQMLADLEAGKALDLPVGTSPPPQVNSGFALEDPGQE